MANALVLQMNRLPETQRVHRAAQYVRMSTDHQQYSIENQAAVIATYASFISWLSSAPIATRGKAALRSRIDLA